ncbi:hypothetical protein J6590_073591 [Homalodisca vitripennis]|nr:hypothetical protein J6590_073591 [Homalodisca vitripennis]
MTSSLRNAESTIPPPPPSPTEVNDLPLPPTQVVDPARSLTSPWPSRSRDDLDLGFQGRSMTLTLAYKCKVVCCISIGNTIVIKQRATLLHKYAENLVQLSHAQCKCVATAY